MAYFCLFKSVPLANGENSDSHNGVCRYVRALQHNCTNFNLPICMCSLWRQEAGNNLSRWQRKQVIWKKNLSYSDEWTTVEEEETHVASTSLLELLFNFFFQGLLGVKDGWPTGICRWSFPGRQRTILLNLATQVALITQFNLAFCTFLY